VSRLSDNPWLAAVVFNGVRVTAAVGRSRAHQRAFREGRMNKLSDDFDLGFVFKELKNGVVEIFHRGRLAATLRGNEALDFKRRVQGQTSPASQQLMARVTGNYKRGNEREARRHPRNRP
jgi:hypothetical protein